MYALNLDHREADRELVEEHHYAQALCHLVGYYTRIRTMLCYAMLCYAMLDQSST